MGSRRARCLIGLLGALIASCASAELRALRVSVPDEVVFAYPPAIVPGGGALLPALCWNASVDEVRGIVVPLDDRGRAGTPHVVGHHPWSMLYRAVPLTDGWLASGTASRFSGQPSLPWLVRLDAGGAPIREFTMDPGDEVHGGFLEPAPDGSAFLWANACPSAATCRPWIAKFDADGTLLWERSYGGGGNEIEDVTATSGGGAIILSTTSEGGFDAASLIDVSASGDAVRERVLSPVGWHAEPSALRLAANGDLLVIGDTGASPGGSSSDSTWFARLRGDDVISLDRADVDGDAWDAAELPDGRIRVVGGMDVGNYEWRGRVATISAAGDFDFVTALSPDHQVAFASITLHDGAAWGTGLADDRNGSIEGLLAPLEDSRLRSPWDCIERTDRPLVRTAVDMVVIERVLPATTPTSSVISELPPHVSTQTVEVRDACRPPGRAPPAWGPGGRRGGRGRP